MKWMSLILLLTPAAMAQQNTWEVFTPAIPKEARDFAGEDALDALNREAEHDYHLGPGDVIHVQLWEQPELSGNHVLGPDGVVTLPLTGDLKLLDLPRDKARALISEGYQRYYREPKVTLRVEEYHNNHVFVLGKVSFPGKVSLAGGNSLLEVLAQAAPFSQVGDNVSLSKCAIFRGQDKIIWVDLEKLLGAGNLQLNLKLAHGDVVYLPQQQEAMVYVMGEVNAPGAYQLTPRMSFLDALMAAGGPTLAARKSRMMLVRNQDGQPMRLRVKLRDLRKGKMQGNVALQENDLIFVGRNALGHINYFFNQISPFTSLVVISEALADDSSTSR